MSEYEEFTGKSVEEAIKSACDRFGVGLADLDFEILTPGSRGVLGMGAEPARIVAAPRSALGGSAPKREAAEAKPLPPPPAREDRGPRDYGDRPPRRDDRPAGDRPQGDRPQGDRPQGDDRPPRRDDRGPRREYGDRPPRRDDRGPRRDDRPAGAPRHGAAPNRGGAELSAAEVAAVTTARGSLAMERAELEAAEATPEALAAGREILETVMRHLGFEGISVEIREGETSRLNVVGDGADREALGSLIGRKGERLSALQHLVNLMLSRRTGQWTRVLVDVEDYRGRRERQLIDLAARAADRVAETGKMLQLEPMPALERRWIHLALRDNASVATQSIGEEPNRRVVVLPPELTGRVMPDRPDRDSPIGTAPAGRATDPGAGPAWWQRGVVYQVYPRSFADADGDGVGDLPGLIGRLDHLAWLGIDAIWLSPIFRSPMRDFGYDVADYRDVDPVFGSLADLDRLIAEAHGLGIRVLLDFVPNHTSSDHPWFVDARSSRDAAHRDWYVWRDPAPDGGLPNDLVAQFGGPAWTLDPATGQHWYHSFLPEQPDLDWRNPAVRAAMLDHLVFWFARGIDGFRIDVLWMIAKDDAPWLDGAVVEAPHGFGGDPRNALEHGDGPEMEARLAELRDVADSFGDRVLVGEVYMEPARLVRYYGRDGRGAHLPFNFALVTLPWEASAIAAAVAAYEAALPDGAWPNWVLGNHDQSRIASRVGTAQARVAAMLLLTLRGTPTLYYGDELGLPDVPVAPARVVDVAGRDPERSPMPWSRGKNAGFTTGEPWLPMIADAGSWSVEAQRADPGSMLALHRRLLALRRAEPALHAGGWAAAASVEGVVAFDRSAAAARFRVLLNLRSAEATVPLDGEWSVELSTHLDRDRERREGEIRLRPDEGLVLRAG